MLLTFNEMVELIGPYTAAGCLAEYWSTSVEDRESFYLILFIFICLFEFTCGPQVGKRCYKVIRPNRCSRICLKKVLF
jgi:hypothetical protein